MTAGGSSKRIIGAFVVAAGLTACNVGGPRSGSTEPLGTGPGGSVVPDVPSPTDANSAPGTVDLTRWEPVDIAGCECSDGSDVHFLVHRGDPEKVVLYFEGGGACWSAETCGSRAADQDWVATSRITSADLAARGGYFDLARDDNPLADHSWLYVPYCTGDMHLGNTTTDYGDGVVIEHRGYPNGVRALGYLAAAFPRVRQLVVTGTSAGSVATPLFAGLASDVLPNSVDIVTFGDSSGGYPDDSDVSAMTAFAWGTGNAMPDWSRLESVTADEWSIPDLYIHAGRHDPQIRFGRFDYAFDAVQASYAALGGANQLLLGQIDATEERIEDAGVDVATYVAPGQIHTVVAGNAFYTTEVDGVRLSDWVRELIDGPGLPDDVHCTECLDP